MLNHWFTGKSVSVVQLFVGSRGGKLCASRVSENSGENSLGIAVGTSVVDLRVSVVISIVVVVVVIIIILVHGSAFSKLVHVDVVLVVVVVFLCAVSKSLVDQALVGAVLVVVGVGIIIVPGVHVLSSRALVLTGVLGGFASRFVGGLLGLLVGLDKLAHVNNIFSSVGAAINRSKLDKRKTRDIFLLARRRRETKPNLPSALVRGTKLELGQKVGGYTTTTILIAFAFKLRDSSASSELDRVVLDPRAATSTRKKKGWD
jgi:hypothetical protein